MQAASGMDGIAFDFNTVAQIMMGSAAPTQMSMDGSLLESAFAGSGLQRLGAAEIASLDASGAKPKLVDGQSSSEDEDGEARDERPKEMVIQKRKAIRKIRSTANNSRRDLRTILKQGQDALNSARTDAANTAVRDEIKMLMSRHALLHSVVNNE